ncbi:hypothetical protein BKA62DRAFT_774738 [Auriculariales sp. MPI-PUGE-AT-0066]|nr:hypothetical protein BKA62DRAFT_774738 [Auriculariales sp. MPI-PUGE-AT-0066]
MKLMVGLTIISHDSLASLLSPDDSPAELLDALAGGDRAMPQGGNAESRRLHELKGDGIMAGAASPDATATVSPAAWRRRIANLPERFGIPVHHPPGDAEMQPVGRIETVEK